MVKESKQTVTFHIAFSFNTTGLLMFALKTKYPTIIKNTMKAVPNILRKPPIWSIAESLFSLDSQYSLFGRLISRAGIFLIANGIIIKTATNDTYKKIQITRLVTLSAHESGTPALPK